MAIVLAIIGILAVAVLPKWVEMIRKANEGATLGKLGSIRSSLTIYYADNEGFYPADLNPLLTPGSKYLTGMIPVYTYDHGNSDLITYVSTPAPQDTGGWMYNNAQIAGGWGTVWVDCTHTDLRGNEWTTY